MARKLEVEIVGDASSLHRALNQSTGSTSKFGGVLGALKGAAIGAGVAVAGGLVVGLEKSIHAAIDAEKVNARLNVAFRNAGLNAKVYGARIEELEGHSRRLGFTDEEVKNSLGSLITATGNYGKAVRELAIAQDLARFKGVSLETATKALTMANAGQTRALKQLGISIDKVTTAQDKVKAAYKDHTGAAYENALATAKVADKQATLNNVLDVVTQKVHGQADAYSKTAAGAMEQFHAQLQHIEVEIGERLLPVMVSAIAWVGAHWPEITRVVQQSWAQIQPTLKALEALIISVVSTIREHWSTIGPIVRDVVNVIKTNLAILTGVIRLFADLLRGDWSGAWNALKGIVSSAFAGVRAVLATEKDIIVGLARGIGSAMVDGIVSGLSFLGGKIVAMVKAAVNYVIDKINRALEFHVEVNTHIPGVGKVGYDFNPPDIPHLAAGVRNFAGGMALVGEQGPELVNLPSGSSVTPNSALGGGPIYLVTPDGKALAEFIFDGMRGQAQIYKQRTGRQAFA